AVHSSGDSTSHSAPPTFPWQHWMSPGGGGVDVVHGSGSHAVALFTVPPAAVQWSGVSSSHSDSSPSATQQVSVCGGGTGAHGLGSHELASTTVPPAFAQSDMLRLSSPSTSGSSSTNAPAALVAIQQTTVPPPPGGVDPHGSGMHEVAPGTVPPAAVQSAAV